MDTPGSGPDSSQHLKLSLFVFSMPKEFQLYGVFRSDNLEKSDRKSINFKFVDGVNSNEKEGTTNDISLSLDFINVKDGHNLSVF